MSQPTFFDEERRGGEVDLSQLVLYALGEFQERGKVLVERELPLDRLRGALRRAAEKFASVELDDEQAASILSALGARVRRVPLFVAKHPYRIIVSLELSERALRVFHDSRSGSE